MFRRAFASLRSWMKPHTTVPVLPWTATNTWDLSFKRFSILAIGLALFGIGESFLIVSNIGNSPWTVLSEGVSNQFNISIGVATFIVSIGVLLLWIPLREKPGFGTLLNILLIAAAIDLRNLFLRNSPSSINRLSRLNAEPIKAPNINEARTIKIGAP